MPTPATDSEFSFELLVCRWAELGWPPGGDASDADAGSDDAAPVIVSRQLGTKKRRWDTIVIECDPAGLAA
ncbi:DUF5787 family protein, partial [Halolamina salina]